MCAGELDWCVFAQGNSQNPLVKNWTVNPPRVHQHPAAVGQDFKSLITGNSFFRILSGVWVVVSWILGVCLGVFFIWFGDYGGWRGEVCHEFLSLLPLFFLPIFCFHAIMQVQDQHQNLSLSSHEGQKPLISNSQAEKMVRDLSNLIYHVLFLVLYVDTMQPKILTVERITLNYPAEFSEGGAIQENCTLLQCVHVQ